MPSSLKRSHAPFDIISIGDATLDSFLELEQASVTCDINKKNCQLLLSYADKIPVKSLTTTIGGNACNNAVGSSRLGLKAAFYSVIGDDDLGGKIHELVRREKVAEDYVTVQKKSASNYSVVINYETERTILVYHEKRKYKLPKLADSRWVYLTSMGEGFQVVHRPLLSHLKRSKAKLAFNPGTYQLLAGRAVMDPILKACSILIVNKEEAQKILGHQNHPTMKKLLRELHETGPDMVVITDGPKGAYAFDGKQFCKAKPAKAKVVERTGAGDSFSTGLLAGLAYGKSLSESLTWGATNSASVIQHIGPQAGLLTKREMLKNLKTGGSTCQELK